MHLQIRQIFVCVLLFLSSLACRAQTVLSSELERWKENLRGTSEFDRCVNLLDFPTGEVSKKDWTTIILPSLQDKDPVMRLSIAYITGQKRIYPRESVFALVQLLNDSVEAVGRVAIFAIAAFGDAAIIPLFNQVERNSPPYVNRWNASYTFKRPSSNNEEWFSRSAMRAMLCLRLYGDTMLKFINRYPNIKSYYQAYLLEAVQLTGQNLQEYYSVLSQIRNRTPMGNRWAVDGLLIKKLYHNFKPAFSLSWLKKTRPALEEDFKSLSQEWDFDTTRNNFLPVFLDDSLKPGLSGLAKLYNQLNEVSIYKQGFSLYKDTVISLLKKYKKYEMLFVLLSNIGDSAREISSELKPYIERDNIDRDIRYLAAKALINLHLQSGKNSICLQPINFLNFDSTAEEDTTYKNYYEYNNYFSRSDEMNEGLGTTNEQRFDKKMFAIGSFSNELEKIYLDKDLNRVRMNSRYLDYSDREAVNLLCKFTNDKDTRIKVYAYYALGLTDSLTSEIEDTLLVGLRSSSYYIRKAAVEGLVKAGCQRRDVQAFSTVSLFQDNFLHHYDLEIDRLTYGMDLVPLRYDKGGSPAKELPIFQNPPPQPSVCGIIELKTPHDARTMGDLYDLIRKELNNTGSSLRTFSFMNGFALETQVERIHGDGTIDKENQLNRNKLRVQDAASFNEGWKIFWFGDPGHFRATTLMVCSQSSLGPPFGKEIINADDYDYLYSHGSYGLLQDPVIRDRNLNGNFVHFFVYEFKKDASGVLNFVQQKNSIDLQKHFNGLKLNSFKLK